MATYNPSPARPAYVCYDTAAVVPIIGIAPGNSDWSRVIHLPSSIQIDALVAGTSVEVFQRIHEDAAWVSTGVTVTNATGASVVHFPVPPNYVLLVRTGVGDVKAYAQRAFNGDSN